MTMDVIMQSFTRYGGIAIFVIVLLAYFNLPGFPAGVLVRLAGVWAARGNIGYISSFSITVAAGLTGSLILYYLGYKGGDLFLQKYLNRFPRQRPAIEKKLAWIREKGVVGIF